MATKRGIVYKKGAVAATLESDGGRVTFSYLPEYLESDGAPIATTLPKVSEPLVLLGGATPAFFAGLLPEGQRLLAMRERLKTSLSDELGLLLEIGADLIGDVQVLPIGVSPGAPREVYSIAPNDPELSFAKVREEVFGSRASGLPGVQDKVSSKMLNAPVRFAGYDYILKLNPPTVPFAVENEAYFLGLAKKCGVPTAQFQLLSDSSGERALRLRRFDRQVASAGPAGRLALEDGAQVLDVYPAAKYDVGFEAVAGGLLRHCSAESVAGLQLFRQLVFNWLIGNGDAHAKNYSILQNPSGEWKISPAYDLLCTRFYDDRTVALTVQGKNHGFSRRLLIDTAARLGVVEPLATRVIDSQLAALADVPDAITQGALPFPQHLNFEVGRFLRKRAKALASAASGSAG